MIKGQIATDTVKSITAGPVNDNVPNFLLKLVSLLQEPLFSKFVSWNENGTSFVIHDQTNFAKSILPKYFKHNKFSSFVRQLNMYGFRKATAITQGSLNADQEEIEFYHPFFLRDEQQLLHKIKRKVTQTSNKSSIEDVHQILDEMQDIKESQLGITSTLRNIQSENEDLWGEVVSLRQKHAQQQKVVNHLIKFLVSLVQHHGIGIKRKLPLMIVDGSGTSQEPQTKVIRSENVVNWDLSSPADSNIISQTSDSTEGPFITELLSNRNSPAIPVKSQPQEIAKVSDIPLQGSSNSNFDISEFIRFPEEKLNISQGSNVSVANKPVVSQSPSNAIAIPQSLNSNLNFRNDSNSSSIIQYINTPKTPTNALVGPILSLPHSNSGQLVSTPAPKASSDMKDINASVNQIGDNLQNIQHRLSNNQQINLDYELIEELLNASSDDASLSSSVFDPVATMQPVVGNELLPYGGTDGIQTNSNIADYPTEDLLEFLTD